jgi:apolipoprotein N-acyltransferase
MAGYLAQFAGALLLSFIVMGLLLGLILRWWKTGGYARLLVACLIALFFEVGVASHGLAQPDSPPRVLDALVIYGPAVILATLFIYLGSRGKVRAK